MKSPWVMVILFDPAGNRNHNYDYLVARRLAHIKSVLFFPEEELRPTGDAPHPSGGGFGSALACCGSINSGPPRPARKVFQIFFGRVVRFDVPAAFYAVKKGHPSQSVRALPANHLRRSR